MTYTHTNGIYNIINSKEMTNEAKFWAINKLRKLQKDSNKIRSEEQMIKFAELIINNNEIDKDHKYYNLIKSWSQAEVVVNKYGKPIYIKFNK